MNKIPIQPLDKNVLLRAVKIEEKTASGIYRPDAGEQKSHVGEVVAVGTDKAIDVKKGQQVLYKKFEGDEVSVDGVDYVIVEYKDILAVLQ